MYTYYVLRGTQQDKPTELEGDIDEELFPGIDLGDAPTIINFLVQRLRTEGTTATWEECDLSDDIFDHEDQYIYFNNRWIRRSDAPWRKDRLYEKCMPILAGWLTGEQVPQEIIEQTLKAMGQVLERYGGQPAHTTQPGAGLIAFSDPAYAMQHNDDPPVLDWVPDRRTLVYRRPLSGMHPLYYIVDWPAQGNLLFASEIKALLAIGVPRRLHVAALGTLLQYGFIPAPWTIFKDIQIVPAGSILRWQRAKTVLNHATDYHLDEPPSGETSLSQIHKQLDQACANLLPPHEHLVALTGGNSASALASVLTANHTTSTFTIAALDYTKSTQSKI
ncbi:MAG TPA: hypothetical protein VHV10_15010, partial [Ktedonobacteraceae bacterium]|nr:hypothetical protein [Ktedonobacteraceae bacterium]